MRIRRYQPADFPELARLSRALFPANSAEEDEADLRIILSRTDAAVFVLERSDAGGLAGFVEASTRPYVDGCDTSPVGYIEAWYIDADVRRMGYGRALIEAAEQWAREQGYTEIGSDALLDNEVSHEAHRRIGYVEVDRVIQYKKHLGYGREGGVSKNGAGGKG